MRGLSLAARGPSGLPSLPLAEVPARRPRPQATQNQTRGSAHLTHQPPLGLGVCPAWKPSRAPPPPADMLAAQSQGRDQWHLHPRSFPITPEPGLCLRGSPVPTTSHSSEHMLHVTPTWGSACLDDWERGWGLGKQVCLLMCALA